MNKIFVGLAVGLICAVILAEFLPSLFNNGFLDSMAEDFNGPFSEYRNELAGKYMLWGGTAGSVLGLLWENLTSRKVENKRSKGIDTLT